ncbi:MAG: glycosyltransferase family 2 protein [Pseudomonadota bacterium]
MTYPQISVVMPVYNTERYVSDAIKSVLAQTFTDFELLIIDDAGSDRSVEICRSFNDPRIRIISQENRGLAGARNTGIRNAWGRYIGFLDSDDLWETEKLQRHFEHLEMNPKIGVSYAASSMMDDHGKPLRLSQTPKLKCVEAKDIFLRNPVGNGSAPVVRSAVFRDIAMRNYVRGEWDYFDESFRQSEDIECWLRIALTTTWKFEGVDGRLTRYRINESGLSANVIRQFESWCRVRDKASKIDPGFVAKWGMHAEAYQLRYLARRCIRMGDGAMAWSLACNSLKVCPDIIRQETAKTITTLCAALALRLAPGMVKSPIEAALQARL